MVGKRRRGGRGGGGGGSRSRWFTTSLLQGRQGDQQRGAPWGKREAIKNRPWIYWDVACYTRMLLVKTTNKSLLNWTEFSGNEIGSIPDPRGCLKEAGSVSWDEIESHHGGQRLELGDVGADAAHLTAVLGIRHIRFRIRTLANGSGSNSGSDSFLQWLKGWKKKKNFPIFFSYKLPPGTLSSV